MAKSELRSILEPPPSYELTFVGGEVVCISNPTTIGLFWVLIFLLIFNSYILIRIFLRNKYWKDGK